MKWTNCGSENISIERRPDGYCRCQYCEHKWKRIESPKRCKVCQPEEGEYITAINYEVYGICDGRNEATSNGWHRAKFCPECGRRLSEAGK